ncbi:MAG: hypothetical protein HOE90_24405 [Bacteriovoracaceae bacterium]|jgi:hypothetical protein|nr:hypothetical protein [Bacteriovoracaceae bacterium]
MKLLIPLALVALATYFYFQKDPQILVDKTPVLKPKTLPLIVLPPPVVAVKVPTKKVLKKILPTKSLPTRNAPNQLDQTLPVQKTRDEHTAIQNKKGELIINSVFIDGPYLIAHGDIIVANKADLEALQSGKQILTLPRPTLWPGGVVPIKIDRGLANAKAIATAVKELEEASSLTFPIRDDEKNYIHFKKGKMNCYSKLGMIGGAQDISLSPNCQSSHITHEILHAVGLLHEQNREDRDDSIIIYWENIEQSNWLQFQKIKNDFIDALEHPFDFDSIMLYSSEHFSKYPDQYSMTKINGDIWPATQKKLSTTDLKKINKLYPAHSK